MTRACDLLCRHCRAEAQPHRHPLELSTDQARRLMLELTAFPKPPLLVLTGGDPIKRPDVFKLVDYAVELGLQVAMTPSATPLMTRQAIAQLKAAGLHRLAVSLDGADAATHDDFRRVSGSFAKTLQIIEDARELGLPMQVNTTVAGHNVDQLERMAALLRGRGILLWSVFFLIPTGRAVAGERLSAGECEKVFEVLWRESGRQPYAIKTTEAPHYRRFLLQRGVKGRLGGLSPPERSARFVLPTARTNDGKGILFISHIGEIYPSGFLPIECGRFPRDSVVRVYQESPLFWALRDANRLGGKCGVCEYRHICGGSRARAYGLSGDPLGEEPDCVYVPPQWAKEQVPC
jgi:radical SAM protein